MIFLRSPRNPILKPEQENAWEAVKVYNPAAIYESGVYQLFYRARGPDWISRIGYAESQDGENFTRSSKPLISPLTDVESKGVEDPRIVKIGDTYFITYTGYDGATARLSIATSKDLKTWKQRGPILKNWDYTKKLGFGEYLHELIKTRFKIRKDWSKAGAVFPELIEGKYWMLFGDSCIWLANSSDGSNWTPIQESFLRRRKGNFFDCNFVEMGPPPIKTDKGWLVFYHGVDEKLVYRLGFLILDLNEPQRILFRSREPIFEPEAEYEKIGIVDILPGGWKKMEKMSKKELDEFIAVSERKQKMPRVIFCCGAVLVGDILRIYYGASDSWICTATAKIDQILSLAPAP